MSSSSSSWAEIEAAKLLHAIMYVNPMTLWCCTGRGVHGGLVERTKHRQVAEGRGKQAGAHDGCVPMALPPVKQ